MIFPFQGITGVRLLKLPGSEYITDQMNDSIDQQLLSVVFTQGPPLTELFSLEKTPKVIRRQFTGEIRADNT